MCLFLLGDLQGKTVHMTNQIDGIRKGQYRLALSYPCLFIPRFSCVSGVLPKVPKDRFESHPIFPPTTARRTPHMAAWIFRRSFLIPPFDSDNENCCDDENTNRCAAVRSESYRLLPGGLLYCLLRADDDLPDNGHGGYHAVYPFLCWRFV